MSPTEKNTDSRREYWLQQITLQQHSGQSVKTFCQSRALTEQSFYWWRKKLAETDVPVCFALVKPDTNEVTAEPALELVLSSGDRLRIGASVTASTLRTVLAVLRERV